MNRVIILKANPEFNCQALAVFAKPHHYKHQSIKATFTGFCVDKLRREILAYNYWATLELQIVEDFSHEQVQISLN
jgi:hypothetical protein